ncbi:proline--tRNA ligase, partial [Streptomyces diastaticus]|nr:proline--tRNA ligase [Streptomyces diastaticus]
AEVVDTPDARTIESLVRIANEVRPRADRPWTGADTLKNVVFMVAHPDGTREPLAIGLPGDRDVDEKRLEAVLEPAV